MDKLPDLQTIIDSTLKDHEHVTRSVGASPAAMFTGQLPWSIAWAGADHLRYHGGVVNGLVSGGSKVLSCSSGAAAMSSGPTNPANTDKVLHQGLFTDALNSIRADQLLRTVLIGWSSGVQVSILGGGGGTGVAYDIVDNSNQTGVGYSSFNLGVGIQGNVSLIVGAMAREPKSLNESTCVWSFGASITAVGAFVQVLMSSKDLSLLGFCLTVGGGVGLSSSSGYGSIHTV